ncbi:MAG: hypothetical protein UX08_C0025G0010 [Candidatus Collierbacteria bacterium GW2011_GWB1_45_35]|uniref:DUF5666 domain-containing protein n=2 Tax=Candidatus Collieribacteriota TaxID=1752725 RepID=A0A0G1KNT5_9BACT|nr:MAG: hypothetical protein UW48_C0017G0011 [Microgenomates group bacterium GW2011_GWC1_44_23]KKT85178.1 MAG: hypothetical protein UW84_C0040G0002 [Candidatus Collierbacteria bacterium GW2011_GWA2_44_99]KKT94580.1 MAG: hypothetical protein UW96_C0019G0025 [Candidatus Collierbacteria bacterium GW2011_GWA1_45_15]KKT99637.1 MAG: hypothetical protein UX01_C0008G0005 [Candidatus Collierbacteria bacterium GW2011_GWB2_45_17]KKU04469.1 MAG: hypothetical protein UX08_C0025G0010 [Candidatus Collierbacte
MKTNKLIFLLTFLFVILSAVEGSHSTSVYAATATPSATQDIQDKIKKMVEENISSTEASLREKINLQILVGYVGVINSINSGNITIDSKEGPLIQITTDAKTTFIKSGSVTKLSSLALSDKIIVIGTLIKDDIILAKRVAVVQVDPNPMTSSTLVAKISSVDIKKKTIGLNINNQEVLYTLTKKSTIKLIDLKTDQTIFAITKKYEGKDYLSRAKVIQLP